MFTTVGNKVFFVATYQNNGELWVSDGTAARHVPLTSLQRSRHGDGSFQRKVALLEAVGPTNCQLEVSDGTVAGTTAVTTFNNCSGLRARQLDGVPGQALLSSNGFGGSPGVVERRHD